MEITQVVNLVVIGVMLFSFWAVCSFLVRAVPVMITEFFEDRAYPFTPVYSSRSDD